MRLHLLILGMTVAVIGWLYLFGASRATDGSSPPAYWTELLVPLVLVPLAVAGVFPHFLLTFAVLDPTLGIGRLAPSELIKPA